MLLSIQYLRAFAALAVVALHTGWTRTELGSAGVDVFFVISGFIMVHVSRRETTPLAFLRARVMRVVPLYWIATAFAVAIGVTNNPDVAKSLLLWPDFAHGADIWPTLGQGWTLEFEAFFYVVFAASLALPARWRLEAATAFLLACMAAGQVLAPETAPGIVYTHPLMSEFLAGAWLHRAWRAGRLPSGWAALGVCGVGLALFAVQAGASMGAAWQAPTFARPLLLGVPALMVVAGLLGAERRLPHVGLLRRLGDASYAVYLTHWFVLTALRDVLHPLPAPVAVTLALGVTAAVGVAVHYGIERPLGEALSGRARRPSAALAAV